MPLSAKYIREFSKHSDIYYKQNVWIHRFLVYEQVAFNLFDYKFCNKKSQMISKCFFISTILVISCMAIYFKT